LPIRSWQRRGALVSVYLPDHETHPDRFIERDLLQSSISRGVIPIQSELRCGSMHTMSFAC
jgi:DNA processing protein